MKHEIEQSLEEQHSMEKQLEEQQEQLEQLGQLEQQEQLSPVSLPSKILLCPLEAGVR